MTSLSTLLALLTAISCVESNHLDAARGDGGAARGRYQIHREVVRDVNRFTGSHWVWSDADNPVIAQVIARDWLRHYADAGDGLEQLARKWNGGPDGDKKHATIPYWNKVRHELARQSGLDSRDTMGTWLQIPASQSPGAPSGSIRGTIAACSSPSVPATPFRFVSSASAATEPSSTPSRFTIRLKG